MSIASRLLGSPRTQLILAVAFTALAILSAVSMIGEVRLVNILLLFFGGFGTGAHLVAALTRHRLQAKRA